MTTGGHRDTCPSFCILAECIAQFAECRREDPGLPDERSDQDRVVNLVPARPLPLRLHGCAPSCSIPPLHWRLLPVQPARRSLRRQVFGRHTISSAIEVSAKYSGRSRRTGRINGMLPSISWVSVRISSLIASAWARKSSSAFWFSSLMRSLHRAFPFSSLLVQHGLK